MYPTPIRKLGLDDIRRYLLHLETRNLKDTSIKRKMAILKVFFGFCEDEGFIDDSPTRKLKKKYRMPKRLPRVMSLQEIKALLKAAYDYSQIEESSFIFEKYRGLRDRLIIEMLFVTGIRIDELVRLNIADLDIEARTVIIFGKGRKERLIYISSDEVMGLLSEYLLTRYEYYPDGPEVFLNRFKSRLSVHSIGSIFKRYCKLAGISRHFTPHCLRHTMATMLMENGADIRSVQEILGHSRISTTEIYLTVSRRRKEEVLKKFNQRNALQIAL